MAEKAKERRERFWESVKGKPIAEAKMQRSYEQVRKEVLPKIQEETRAKEDTAQRIKLLKLR